MLESIPPMFKEPFKWDFIIKCAAALTPIIIMAVIFMMASRATTGYMIGTFDVVITHFDAAPGSYSPLLPMIDKFFKDRMSLPNYDIYFGLMAIVVCLYGPFVLLYRITGNYRYPLVFLYATAIPIFNLINGTIPQAIVIDFMLLAIAFPRWFLAFAILAALTHAFGLPAMAITWMWMRWRKWDHV